MERLTVKGVYQHKDEYCIRHNFADFRPSDRNGAYSDAICQAIDLLGAYEDTDRSPNEITALDYDVAMLKQSARMANELAKENASLRAQFSEPQQWTSIEDELPKDDETVYVYCPTNNDSVEATVGMMVRAHKYTGYTHWMPRIVPNPPKEGN